MDVVKVEVGTHLNCEKGIIRFLFFANMLVTFTNPYRVAHEASFRAVGLVYGESQR